ncbi:MAG: CoA transferase, partial [Alphaproteobacteria bacterium]|nr:CoA transferase [Alphaproteobacteria bacterium]
MPGPFHGLKVVDLTTVVVGPYTTQLLADMGADVTKVEAPEGDMTRMGAPRRHAGMGNTFLQLNRNKRAIALDLKTEAGAEALRKLIAGADIFIHNMRPEPLARLGFDYESVQALNPGLVYCNIWGFGREGRYAGRAAFDDVIQGTCGLVALEAFNGRETRFVPMLIADKTTALFAAYAIAAAAYHKLATGEGQEVEVPMFESMTSFTMIEHLAGNTFEPSLGPSGSERHA